MEGNKGPVCVTGATGYLGSWLIKTLLEDGYSVHGTIRSDPENNKDIDFLLNLPKASTNLKLFQANLDQPESFTDAIRGCNGVFHMAHPMVFNDKESVEAIANQAINGTISLLKICLNSKTVKRVVYTSSGAAVVYSAKAFESDGEDVKVLDESSWSDIDFIKASSSKRATYPISKTMTEKSALEFGEQHGLDVVSILPSFISGPFLSPQPPGSVSVSLGLILGKGEASQYLRNFKLVHVDDVARAHIFLLENASAKGRYICSAGQITIHELSDLLASKYPDLYTPQDADNLKEKKYPKTASLSSKRLIEAGFKFGYDLEEIYDDTIKCCKEKGIL